MKSNPGVKLIAAFSATLMLLLFITFFSINNNRQYLTISRELQEANLLMQNLDGAYKQSGNIISAYRGYGITGDPQFVDEFRNHTRLASADQLKTFGAQHPAFSVDIDSLLRAHDRLVAYCRLAFEADAAGRSAYFSVQQESELKNNINRLIGTLEVRGREKLRFLENEQQHLAQNATRVNYLLSFFCFLVLSGIFIMLNREFNRKKDD